MLGVRLPLSLQSITVHECRYQQNEPDDPSCKAVGTHGRPCEPAYSVGTAARASMHRQIVLLDRRLSGITCAHLFCHVLSNVPLSLVTMWWIVHGPLWALSRATL
jgi:hypothetical protein